MTTETSNGQQTPQFGPDGWFLSRPLTVPVEWIDYNGHMNMAYYNRVCDLGLDDLFDHIGIGASYRRTRNLSIYTAEFHTRFLREVKQAEILIVATQLMERDEKRLHFFQEVRHAGEGWIAATGEGLCLHVDMTGPKVAAFPDDIGEEISRIIEQQKTLPWPRSAGRSIGIVRRPAARDRS
ncbi:thioesterase family protein [Notoacmeibacter sp. MSK16QG-6]|uniref:thioesterase family protein n=1 Tax=Notoacmeibacter sp. MSK16QG-6 TaxID=2957982 RepID=UPI0020A1AC6B|nr:thioesterase family protein [Notoacmeibacter sp. MSK16QG-6]MCP1199662.1 thioesterase family protein [Notoacmeibacter sp. MSK16QG-6]